MNSDYSPAAYGDGCADIYDQIYGHVSPDLIASLVKLAAGGPVLEFGIGTGRIALQLARSGLAVTGIEASSAMLRKLLEKEVPALITPVRGNFTATTIPGTFTLIYCIHSTVLLLPPDHQKQCFSNAVKHLRPGGTFLLEAAARPGHEYQSGKNVEDSLGGITSCYRLQTVCGVRDYSVTQFYAPPWVLDRMADETGLTLVERWSDWLGAPFTQDSPFHVSLYSQRRCS